MACRRFAGGWRHKKGWNARPPKPPDGHSCINAAGKIQPHLDVNKTLFLPFFFQREEKDLHRKDDCMKINWSLRFHNKVWLTTLLAVVCTFVFNLLDLFGIETTVAQEQVMQLGAALLSLLSTLGVVIDPTTPGVSDSQTVIERK